MRRQDEGFFVALGVVGAILLGMALIPLRALTPASNLTFPFLLLTIAIAELGGATAVVATALASSLSLDFFLTEPYLRLSMEDEHDVAAFAGLTVCGLVVAGIAASRARKIAVLGESSAQLQLLRQVVRSLGAGGELARGVEDVLRWTAEALPVTALSVRDTTGALVAEVGGASRTIPDRILEPDVFRVEGTSDGTLVFGAPAPLPAEGARLPLRFQERPLGWLDVWGTGETATPAMRTTLLDVAWLISAALAR